MKHLSQNINPAQAPGFYYAQVYALTPKETQTETKPGMAQSSWLAVLLSPFVFYASIVLFFALFVGVMIIQIVNKSLNLKRIVTTLVVAFMIASVPMSLKTALEVTSLQSKASSDEIPHAIEIKQETKTSVQIQWTTVIEKVGIVRFSLSPLQEGVTQVVIADTGKKTLTHTVHLTGLEAEKEYEFEILSGSKWYNDQGQPLKIRLY